jgi:hypothetical protein
MQATSRHPHHLIAADDEVSEDNDNSPLIETAASTSEGRIGKLWEYMTKTH